MKIENLIELNYKKLDNKIRRAVIEKVKDANKQDFYLYFRYSRKTRRLEKFIYKIGNEVIRYKHIPYFGVIVNNTTGRWILDYYIDNIKTPITEFSEQINNLSWIDISVEYSIDHLFRKSDKVLTRLWNLDVIGKYEINCNGRGIAVAVIDTGIDYNHIELKEKFSRDKGYNFINNSKDPFDDNSHGTHVAGIIAGNSCGVAPGVKLYALKVLDYNGYGTEFDIIRALEWCLDKNVKVVNMSLGAPYASFAFEELCEICSNNMYLVAAAGNEGKYMAEYPAAFDNSVISVASINSSKFRSYFSNIHETIDISAPGEDIYSSIPYNRYEWFSGTSMATPHISGAIAVYLSKFKRNIKEGEEIMKRSAEKLDYNDTPYPTEYLYGAGLVRIDKMLKKN